MLQDAQLVGQISRHLMRTLDFILSKGSPPYPRKAKLSAKKKKIRRAKWKNWPLTNVLGQMYCFHLFSPQMRHLGYFHT